jgi:RNA polymerase sigma-70 factor (ECF subfamily)
MCRRPAPANGSFEARPEPDVQAARSGDRAAFERLVARFQTDVFNLCLRVIGDFDTADDAAQETFIATMPAISQFRGGNFRSWLFRIATNKCRDQYRASARRRQVPLEDGVESPPDSFVGISRPDPTPEQYLELQALHSVIQAGFQSLPPQQREAFVLRDVNGLPYEEIGDILSVELGTVKSRIARARARMRNHLLANQELLPDSARLPDGRSRT